MRRSSLTVLAILLLASGSPAQTGIPSIVGGLHGDAISITGDIGTYGELYSISGRESRRPSATARLYFRPTISFYDALSVSLNLLLSTEGSSRSLQHQLNEINQLGIRPQWDWGYANAGDFSETYTPLTLSGITIRGGGVTINPGLFRFSVVGGFTNPAGYTFNSGDRYMYGGRLGIGRENGSFIDVVFLRVRDVPSTFQVAIPDTLPPVDSTQTGTLVNKYEKTPQENMVLGLTGSLRLFDDAMTFNFEANGSAFTRDMTSTQLTNEKIPSAFTGVFTPRISTSVDVAVVTGLQIRLQAVSLKAGYRYIGPGYNSLGVASLFNDQQEFQLGAQVRQPGWTASLDWSRQNDNLIDQKLNTTIRHRYNGSLTLRPSTVWSVSLLGNYLNMRNHAFSDTNRVDFATVALGTNQVVLVSRDAFLRSVSFNYFFSRSIDHNPLRPQSRSRTHTISFSAMMAASADVSIGAGVAVINSRFGSQSATTTQSYTITPLYRTLENRLVTSFSIGLSLAGGTTSLLTGLTSSYRLTPANTITLIVRRMGLRSDIETSGNYQEYIASLTVSHHL